MTAPTRGRSEAIDRLPSWVMPWLFGTAATVLYLLTLQRRLYNDGIFFEDKLRLGGEQLLYNHILYLPLAKLVQWTVSLVHPIDGEAAMKLLAAVVGGAGVGMTFVIARAGLRSIWGAASCASLLGVLVGYWFHSTATELHSLHAACATILLLALFRIVDRQQVISLRAGLVLAAGAALTPASHVSGICVLLPLAYVFLRVPRARTKLVCFAGGGLLVFAVAYFAILSRNAGFAGYTTAHTDKHNVLWQDPGRVPGLLLGCAAEFALYSAPAAALIPAGLRVLFRSAPAQAWLCVTWLLAWPLIAWPVADRAVGSYYVPTFPVQALLAVLAMHGAARSLPRAVLVVALAVAPTFVFIFFKSEPLGLAALGGAALLILAITSPAGRDGHGLWLLPIAAAAISAPHIILNVKDLDLHRDRIAAVRLVVERADRQAGKPSLVVFMATDTVENHHWKHFFPGAYRDDDENRVFNPVEVAFDLDPTRVRPRLEKYRRRIREALADQRVVFLVGSFAAVARVAGDHVPLRNFLTELQAGYSLVPAEIPDLWRIAPRDR